MHACVMGINRHLTNLLARANAEVGVVQAV